jgi:heme/copper-type cytochrome/quinol oxidase subunit 3
MSAAPAARTAAPSNAALGTLVFISSEATFFLFLLIAYISYRDVVTTGPTAKSALDVGRTAIFSVCLWASSGTVWLSGWRLRRDDVRGFRLLLGLTILLGLVFLLGQAWEYHTLADENVTMARNLFGSTFFLLTGFHGLHVAIGLVLLCVLFGLNWTGVVRSPHNGALRSIEYYWHFVDAVWVFIFIFVYLWALT